MYTYSFDRLNIRLNFGIMSKTIVHCLLLLVSFCVNAQEINLHNNWQFRQAGTGKWYKATVPGTVHTDLLKNKLIPDPFFSVNESRLEWIDQTGWEYKTVFTVDAMMRAQQKIAICFEGLDTYADVYLNNKPVLQANNMFRPWQEDIKTLLLPGKNELRIYFHPAKNRTDSIAASKLPLVLPDNARVYARKAQYQFGWDWGPGFIGAGIWKPVTIKAYNPRASAGRKTAATWNVQLIRQKDSIGTSFYFQKDGKPIYIKGANWIPADIFLPSAKKEDYRALLLMAKNAGMNMLRVWGGGVYENDHFYDLCDSLGIMVWQDFMFAGGMYPGDEQFFSNVKAELVYQVQRLKDHPCIVIWCGNNEVDEAWHHWGWQNQFNLHGTDSARVWNDYTRLFRDSLQQWVNENDGKRPYVSTSPQYGWGNPTSYTSGDSHYWGVWWGLEGWEKFKTHTGRFVSEWGMQAMPDYTTVQKYTSPQERFLHSPAVDAHQKANDGFNKLHHYINTYFFDTAKLNRLSLEEYTYLTQCLQYYITRNSIATQMSKQPANMGTLLWQLNDCWPVTSWSIIDYYKKPKGGYYATKRAYTTMDTVTDKIYPKHLQLKKATVKIKKTGKDAVTVISDEDAPYVYIQLGDVDGYLSDNYFNLEAGKEKTITYNGKKDLRVLKNKITIISLCDILLK